MQVSVRWIGSVLLLTGSAFAQDGANGPRPVPQCVMCHGLLGHSNTPDAPHLAGQPRMYLMAQLKAFRSGTRQHAVMNVIAKPLTDDDIAAAAGWYSAVALDVRQP
jgi:cytochrome c553